MKLTNWSDCRVFSQFYIFKIIFIYFINGETMVSHFTMLIVAGWYLYTGTFNHPSHWLLFPIHYTDSPSPAQWLISHTPLVCSQKGMWSVCLAHHPKAWPKMRRRFLFVWLKTQESRKKERKKGKICFLPLLKEERWNSACLGQRNNLYTQPSWLSQWKVYWAGCSHTEFFLTLSSANFKCPKPPLNYN